MNYYAMNHAVLDQHVGESLSPKTLRALVIAQFPNEKYDSSYASACHDTGNKSEAWCPVCIAQNGFAVNAMGIVDNGVSGFRTAMPHIYKRGARVTVPVIEPVVAHVPTIEELRLAADNAILALESAEDVARIARETRIAELQAELAALVAEPEPEPVASETEQAEAASA